jgi:hypothetical protein
VVVDDNEEELVGDDELDLDGITTMTTSNSRFFFTLAAASIILKKARL